MTDSAKSEISMKVLLFGARGWIGGQFADVLRAKDVEFAATSPRFGKIA